MESSSALQQDNGEFLPDAFLEPSPVLIGIRGDRIWFYSGKPFGDDHRSTE